MWDDARPPTSVEILDSYAVEIGELRREGLGWESVGWTDGTWFVKVWRESPPSNLAALEQLVLPVPIPVARLTTGGTRSALTDDGRPYGLFPHFNGRHAGAADWRETARVLRLVHDHPPIDLPPVMHHEHSIEALRQRLDHPWIVDRRSEVERYLERLEAVIERARLVAATTTVVHTDFGGWNLLIDASWTSVRASSIGTTRASAHASTISGSPLSTTTRWGSSAPTARTTSTPRNSSTRCCGTPCRISRHASSRRPIERVSTRGGLLAGVDSTTPSPRPNRRSSSAALAEDDAGSS